METALFHRRLDKFSDLSTLFAIQADLLEDPKRGDVMQGCGGARKARIADSSSSKGKRGGFRYIYIYLERPRIIYLLMLYPKNEKSDLSSDERKVIANLVKQYKALYGETPDG